MIYYMFDLLYICYRVLHILFCIHVIRTICEIVIFYTLLLYFVMVIKTRLWQHRSLAKIIIIYIYLLLFSG